MKSILKAFKILNKSDGISLIEVLSAVTIIAVVSIPFTSVFVRTLQISNESNVKSIASQTAVKYMEKYKIDPNIPEIETDASKTEWVRLPSQDIITHDNENDFDIVAKVEAVDTGKYSIELRTEGTDGLYAPQSLYKITVKVYSAEGARRELISVSGLKRGIQ